MLQQQQDTSDFKAWRKWDGSQFLEGLRNTKRENWVDGERIGDVTTHPRLRGGAKNLAAIFDRQHTRLYEHEVCRLRLAQDFARSSLGRRGFLYERFYLTSAARNKQMLHSRFFDRTHSRALLKDMLSRAEWADSAATVVLLTNRQCAVPNHLRRPLANFAYCEFDPSNIWAKSI